MKVLAFGEVMMRLMVPDNRTLIQSDELRYLFCGTGINVLAALRNMGNRTYFSSKLPDNNIGHAAAAHIRKLGIDESLVTYGGNHMGMYFLEVGYGQRPSEVTYMNRNMSSFGLSTMEDYNIDKILHGMDAIHICGISLALNKNTRNVAYELAKKAKEKNITVIFDCNFRPSLWSDEERAKAKYEYEKMLYLSDMVLAGEKDAKLLLEIKEDTFEKLLYKMKETYNIDVIFGTERNITTSSEQIIKGFRLDNNGFVYSKEHKLSVLDRIGGGDGFAAGAIHGYINKMERKQSIEFAICSGVLAHTIYGDSPIVTLSQINGLMENGNIDIIR